MYVLIVDDNRELAHSLATTFSPEDKVDCFYTFDDGLERLSYMSYDVICLDVYLDEGIMNGIQLCKKARERNPNAIIIMFTGATLNSSMTAQMMEAGANSFIEKTVANFALVKKAIALIEEQRKKKQHTHKEVFQHPIYSSIIINEQLRFVLVDGEKRTLDGMPLKIFRYLFEHPNEYFHCDALAREVKDTRSHTGISIKMHIATIRKAITPYNNMLKNDWGGWYGFILT